jgi:hypothetical protein
VIRLAIIAMLAACGSKEEPAPPAPAPTPPPPALDRVDAIASGTDHVCALRDARVYCWGALGSTARPVSHLAPAQAISSGGRRTCSLSNAGQIACWGSVFGGPTLGTIPIDHDWASVEAIDLGRPIVKMGVAPYHRCMLTDRKDLYCAGLVHDSNSPEWPFSSPQLIAEGVDDFDLGPRFTRYSIAGKLDWIGPTPDQENVTQAQLAAWPASEEAECGVTRDKHVSCRGLWPITYPGGPLPSAYDKKFVTIAGIDRVETLAMGQSSACVLTTDRAVWCWGKRAPAKVALPAAAIAISVGGRHACALLETHRVMCWRDEGDATPSEIARSEEPLESSATAIRTVGDAVERIRRHDTPTPVDLSGTTWEACLDGCAECTFHLQLGQEFVADSKCPKLHTGDHWTGTWSRAGQKIHVRERPSPNGTLWEWDLEMRGTELRGTRHVHGEARGEVVTGFLR